MSPQSSGRGKLTRWWFVIRGDEEAMSQLEEKWNAVAMQVGWKLEPLYSFSDVVVTHQSSDDSVHNSPATPPSPTPPALSNPNSPNPSNPSGSVNNVSFLEPVINPAPQLEHAQ